MSSIIEMEKITKKFPGVVCLNNVDFSMETSKVHVLVGENGAGKSSLVKVLTGVYKPENGIMRLNGKAYTPQKPSESIKQGIRAVYQEFNLMPYMSVAENIFFEKLPERFGVLSKKRLYKEAEKILGEVGLNINPSANVSSLGIAQMQLVEICKAISGECKVIIFDEPTATLTSVEIEKLFKIIEKLKAKNIAILYISHHLEEIFKIGDYITIMRNGEIVHTEDVNKITINEIVKYMVGREMESEYPYFDDVKVGETFFRVSNLKLNKNSKGVSFGVRKGEILGIAGLVGSGRTETARAIFGADKMYDGSIELNGKKLNIKSTIDSVNSGICLLTEDRKNQGLVLDMKVSENISLTNIKEISKYCLINKKLEIKQALKYIKMLNIKTPNESQKPKNLSGGNQQKVVLAKWLIKNPEIIILDEPTRGIDVGAKYEIYLLLWDLARSGKGVVVISSDLPELMGICHRMLVFSNQIVAGELKREDFNSEEVLKLAYKEYINKAI